ncbi:CD209 antigen-like protein E [Thalassophryne amazonica]|uniref:CD209 antigen-like protein E n=1 Tax=Thalassophryne amazonica TaxID=390379 RepID=UPI0014722447|nr:CD209 antigen-like protein E [Thalassophryne amazonica]XP_034015693.1 CD209 antigen-like protein E [Thalassophryne amazonica]
MIKEEPNTSVQLCTSAAMAKTHTGTGGNKFSFPSYRAIIMCLGLLNVVLLIVAIVIGIKCAKVKEDSVEVSHSVAAQVISELNLLRSNHSEVMEAEEAAKKTLESKRKEQRQLMDQIEQKKTINDQYQKQVEVLVNEKLQLKSNLSLLEGTCGKCPLQWTLMNSTCYFFSIRDSSRARKNWLDSRADCIIRGADLVVIDDAEEQRYVNKILRYSSINKAWIGVIWNKTTQTWIWVNNVNDTEPEYWFFGAFQPDSRYNSRGTDYCGSTRFMYDNTIATQNKEDCNGIFPWICEMMFT